MSQQKLKEDPVNPRPAMSRAWENVGEMTIMAAVEACFTVPAIEFIEIAKVLPARPAGVKVGEIRPGNPNAEDAEQYIFSTWGAGVYVLSPIYRGHRIRSRNFAVGGEAAFEQAVKGPATGSLDVNARIAEVMERKSAMATIRELDEMEKKGDDMTPEQLERILEKVVAARPAGPDPMLGVLQQQNQFMMEMLKLERDRADKLMAAATEHKPAATDPNTLIGLGAALLPLVGKLPSKSLGGIMNGIMRIFRPQEAPPETGWTPDQVMAVLQTAGPMVQQFLVPVIDGIRQALTGQPPTPAPAGAPPQPATFVPPQPAQPNPGGAVVPLNLDAEEKMAMDLFFQFLSQQDYESCWSTLGTTEKTLIINMAVMELKDKQRPESLLPLLMRFDPRVAGLQAQLADYLKWCKDVKKPEIDKEEEEADREEREEAARRNGSPGA